MWAVGYILFFLAYDSIVLSYELYDHRFSGEATTTFYYHWKWGDYVTENCSDTPYIYLQDYNNYRSFEHYKKAMALKYPDLISNSQFIYCTKAHDPQAILSGRPPLFRKLEIKKPTFDKAYHLQHYYGYNQPFNNQNVTHELMSLWRRKFIIRHQGMGEYLDFVHEKHDSLSNKRLELKMRRQGLVFDRPSLHEFDKTTSTIYKMEDTSWKSAWMTGLSFGTLFIIGFVNCLISE